MFETFHILADALARGLLYVAAQLLDNDQGERSMARFVRELLALELRGYRGASGEPELLAALRGALDDAGAPGDDAALAEWFPAEVARRIEAGEPIWVGRALAGAIIAVARGESAPTPRVLVQLDWPVSRHDDLAILLVSLRARIGRLDDWRAPLDYAMAVRHKE